MESIRKGSYVKCPAGPIGQVVRLYYGTAWVRLSSGLVVTCYEERLELIDRPKVQQISLF